MEKLRPWDNGKLKIMDNGKYLCHENGTPFFWLGDTGWLMIARLTREEIRVYLENRQAKGFNVIQVMLMNGFPQKNVYGKTACTVFDCQNWPVDSKKGYDPHNYGYWDHLDFALDVAKELGLYLALVPVWGSIVKGGNVTEDDARAYGEWLGKRYGNRPNIIWLNGGDIRGCDNTEVWNALGNSIRKYDREHLMTFHPFGRTVSSVWFKDAPWLDFNMFQSGHRRYDQLNIKSEAHTEAELKAWKGEDNYKYVLEELSQEPLRPIIDGEPSYEGIPQGLHDPSEPYWNDDDCRRYAYWSVFAGAFGHTFGNSAIMQMNNPEKFGKGNYGVRETWQEALDQPGAAQMTHLKNLMTSVKYYEGISDQSVIANDVGEKYNYISAFRGKDYVFLYTYTGRKISVVLGKIEGAEVDCWWFSPKKGTREYIGRYENKGITEFVPDNKEANGNDFVLIIIKA